MSSKVLCIGDSMSLPGHLNQYEDTWIYHLKKEFPQIDFITFFQRGATTDLLTSYGGGNDGIDNKPLGADVLEFYEPDSIIIQLGIVDCAPRILNRNTLLYKLLIRQPKKVQDTAWRVIKKFRKREASVVDVSIDKFRSNLDLYIQRAQRINVSNIILVKIGIPDERITKRSPLMLQNVVRYNKVIDQIGERYPELVSIVAPLNEDAMKKHGIIYQDGYHTNSLGNRLVYESLASVLIKAEAQL